MTAAIAWLVLAGWAAGSGPGTDALYWPLLDKASAALGRGSLKGTSSR